jgi:hypothetical protein
MKLQLVQWNIRGYKAKIPYIHQLLDYAKPDVICLQETWLQNHHTISLRNYQAPIREDRADGPGGGVLIMIKDNLPYTALTLTSNLEVTACTVHVNGTKLTLASLYIPPNYKNRNFTTDMDDLLQQLPHPFILTGDFNAHHHSWGSEYSDVRGRLIDKWTTVNQLDILNTSEPTYLCSNGSYTHIDLTITTNDISPTLTWQPMCDTYNSDHFPILIGTDINSPAVPSNQRWNLKTANWSGYKQDLKLADSYLSPTQASGALIDSIKRAADKNIQLTKNKTDHKYCKYWWTPECTTAVKAKKKAYNKYKRQLGNMNCGLTIRRPGPYCATPSRMQKQPAG